jgi:hypothetical protein
MEDDVFFQNEDTLLTLDHQYIDDDLLSNNYGENTSGEKNTWHWNRINIQYPPPYYNGMMCAVRFSKTMMNCLHNYAKEHKTLFFLEALFPTIAIKNHLKYSNPSEFKNIHYKYDFKEEEIDTKNLFHPVKDLSRQIYFRKIKEINIVEPNRPINDRQEEGVKVGGPNVAIVATKKNWNLMFN